MFLHITVSLLFLGAQLSDATTTYDVFTAEPASEELLSYYESTGVKSTCTVDVEDCDATERRRVDGSCNNLNNPVKATFFEPVYRLLPPNYYNGSSRLAADGTDLELPRVIRNRLLCSGKASSLDFTQSMTAFGIFAFGDVASIHDFIYFLQNKTDCCTSEGMKSRQCSPNMIPEDDPVHRFSGIRCLNLTTPLVYSDFGCTNDTEPYPINQATGVFDLSHVYDVANKGDSVVRSREGGLLSVDVDDDGIIWPPNGNGFCPANQPGETRCFGNYPNVLLPTTLVNTWFMRQHNYFATQLAAVNPCWDDETLFRTAYDMNIACYSQVYFYEWLPAVIGYDRLVEKGVLSNDTCFRDVYDESIYPATSIEFAYTLRWFHTAQEGTANMYDTDGTFMKEYPMLNLTFRPGFLGIDNNMKYFTQHMFRQSCGAIDHGADPDMLDNGLPYIQESVDIPTSDLHKSRLLGFSPYVDYVHYCTGHNITSFEDLSEHIEEEKIQKLKTVYKDVRDIDLMAGLWVEKLIEGGHVPATLACLVIEYVYKAVRFDRHFYERPNRPHPFTENQLASVRQYSMAQFICNSGDGVSEVQPQAFFTISTDNPLTPCSEIPSIDFTAWADDTCCTTDSSSSSASSSSDATTS